MEMQQRYFIELAYNGSDFNGWQIQPNAPSVQETIEKALTKLFGGKSIQIVGCGRTDTGVHAHYFIAHVDLPIETNTAQLVYKLNKILPSSIAVFSIFQVEPDYHARFSATFRMYRYFLNTTKNPFTPNSLYFPQELDYDSMNEAAHLLVGKKDFTSFSKLHTDVKTNICTVFHANWVQTKTGLYFEIKADRFLRNMVRAIVGTLMDVGLGKIPVDAIHQILDDKNRGSAKVSVPAHALFLWDVGYPTKKSED